jgi:hypothetical protein
MAENNENPEGMSMYVQSLLMSAEGNIYIVKL